MKDIRAFLLNKSEFCTIYMELVIASSTCLLKDSMAQAPAERNEYRLQSSSVASAKYHIKLPYSSRKCQHGCFRA
ncbi:hypothetical protein T4B_15121 [Trichinella pseudospiralis]|uniref:Uncharacterized protein n=1 Tax=Trichinella pseudospiralis TaxID=6337 RepID=A0A0V1KD88_TRIPS|nr:hypothetical protein T4A_8500 [Trichinella pseudospiralis]KRZ29207.1 hypothetical protein T4B_15121 [Trichinella pseudospiralis]KRZ45263.1 hypothetical protein T4C_2597 [Trichinella pseudospiralis]